MTKAGKRAQQAARFKTTEEESKEVEEAKARLASAEEIHVIAAVAAVLSKEQH